MARKDDLVDTARAMLRLLVDETSRLPRWSQPFVIVVVAICFTILLVVMTPFLFFSRRRFRQRETLREVRRHLEKVWSEEGPDVAVTRLRSLLSETKAAEALHCEVGPFGEVNAVEAQIELTHLLYSYEVTRKNWAGALEVAEQVVGTLGEQHAVSWLLPKARCLTKLGRYAEARELLFRLRAFEALRDEANELLSKLPSPAA